MAAQYTTIPIQDLGAGIDSLSAENNIKEGFSEWLLNAEPKPNGYLTKRRGYQGFAGYLPLRVTKIEYSDALTNNLAIFFDSSVDVSSIDLSRTRSTPLIIQGRTSADNDANVGDFPNTADAVHYYPGFSSSIRRTFQVGTNTLTILQSEHGFITDRLFVSVFEATSVINNNNSLFVVDSITIDSNTFDITIGYTNSTGNAFDVFTIVQDKSAVSGETYNNAPVTIASSSGTNTLIAAATHGLSNFNIIARAFVDTSTELVEIIPESVEIAANGDVSITVLNNSPSSIDVIYVLTVAPILNVSTGSAASGATVSVTINSLPEDFIIAKCYLEDVITADKFEVIPNSIIVDTDARTATIEFVNSSPDAANFYVYYETFTITANKLTVTASVIAGADVFTDERPQLTVWGLSHESLYGANPTEAKPGWVNHIDSYKSTGDARVVAGLGGNLFAARAWGESGVAENFLLPQLYPNIRNRVNSSVTVGPAFVDTTDSSTRTRGYIQFDGAGEGWAKGTAVNWDSGTGWMKYTLSCPNLVINGTLSTIISNTPGIEDWVEIEQSEKAINSGKFKIMQIANPSTDVLEIWVDTDVTSSDYDEQDGALSIGVFTDRLTTATSSRFLPADLVQSELFGNDDSLTVVGVSGTTMVLDSFTEPLDVPLGLRIVGSRVSRILPLRELDGTDSTTNVVAGDMLNLTGINRLVRAKYVNSNSDISVTIDGDGETATVTLGSGDTSNLSLNQSVLIKQGGVYTGVYSIVDIPSDTTFTVSSTLTDTGISGTLAGKVVEVDEDLPFADTVGSTNFVTVERRWIPAEAPTDNFDTTPSTYVFHFDSNSYSEQPNIQSTMVADNLYLTQGDDEVTKFDGVNIYRAGLPRWQPHLFITKDTSPAVGGTIPVDTIESGTVAAVTAPASRFKIPLGDETVFRVGMQIQHTDNDAIYRIVSVANDGTNGLIFVDRAITGTAAGSLKQVHIYKYYFRLNAVDANNNVIASAVTGSEDMRVELAASTQVRIRLTGLPAWDIYDYDKLEVEIFRTLADLPAPFYRLTTIPLSFDNGEGYIDYADSSADEVIGYNENLDAVNSVLKGSELGTAWSLPLRSKYVTSSNNRLVLGNIKGYPELDMRLIDVGTRITPALLSGKIATLRRDNEDAGTTTNMIDRARYEFVTTGAVTIDGSTDITNNGTSFVVDSTAHGLVAGNWVYFFHSAVADGNELKYAGWFQVASATTDAFTINFTQGTYTPTADDVDRYVVATDERDVPVWMGTDGNYAVKNGNRTTPGNSSVIDSTGPNEFIACRRLANAINASMKNLDYTIAGQEEFNPWVIANAGSEYSVGQLILTQPKVENTTLEIQLWAFSGYNIFVNNLMRASESSASAQTLLFPSRILVSYPNYPEIFDNPTAAVDSESDSAIDVNPADGQEITAVIPFFGDSTFGAALKSGVVVVFKTNSIYLVDLAAKAAGINPVQRIESRGQGCTAPLSVTVTKDGLMFANESGIYRLNKEMGIDEQGRYLERYWREDIDKSQMELMVGHNYPGEKQYKLSVPTVDAALNRNSQVLVYNSTREYTGESPLGSWTVYDNHPATGWANLEDDAYMATTRGQVFSMRHLNEASDFRDDASAISCDAILRAMDFGDGGIRKGIIAVIVHYRDIANMDNTELLSAVDLTDDFQEADMARLNQPKNISGINEVADRKVTSIKYSINDRKGVYFQLRFTNDGYDEPMEISKIDIRVSGLSHEGITEAAST